jgi:putative FmdB family regulatory protein
MPIYAYRCTVCGHAQDVLQKLSDPLLTVCPSCGAEAFAKQLTAAGFQLKGSGWYVTDFRGGNTAAGKPEGAEGEGAAAAGADKPAGPAAETGAAKPAEKPAQKPADQAADKGTSSSAKPADKAAAPPPATAAPTPPAGS